MSRMILAVLAGAVFWAAFWLSGTALSMKVWPQHLSAGQPITHTGLLLMYIAYGGVLLSVGAGYVTAAVAKQHNPMRAVWILAIIQLALGIGFEVSAWHLMPAWYHISFLGFVVPATVYGGMLRSGAKLAAAHDLER